GWEQQQEQQLFECLAMTDSKFILSTWHHNDFRRNEYIDTLWNGFNIYTREHFYHVGGSEKNRNPMVEAIVTNFEVEKTMVSSVNKQLELFGHH
ncbi:MAG: DNA adenine methylase, partial [Planctomycetes bacterium]|nr:DNA adenine methylase [Planctomycetota bacterium]